MCVCVDSVNVLVCMPLACPPGKIQEYWFCAHISTLRDDGNRSQRDVNMDTLPINAQIIATICRT